MSSSRRGASLLTWLPALLLIRMPRYFSGPIFRAAPAGKTANWIGPVNQPREFVFAPDTGPVIVGPGGPKDQVRRH